MQKGDWARCHKLDCKTLKIINPRPPYLHTAQLLSQIIRKQRQSPPCTQYDDDSFPTTVDQLECHHKKLSKTRRDEFESILSVLKRTFADDVLPEEISLLKMFEATVCNSFSMFDNDLIGVAIGIYLRWFQLLWLIIVLPDSKKRMYACTNNQGTESFKSFPRDLVMWIKGQVYSNNDLLSIEAEKADIPIKKSFSKIR